MSNQFNQNNNTSPIVEQQQPQPAPTHTPTQERARYLQNLHKQAAILHRELSTRLTFLGHYIDHAVCVMDANPGHLHKVINTAQALLNSVQDLVHSAEILSSLGLHGGSEDGQKLESLTLTIGESVGQTGWMYLGERDFREIEGWVSEADKLFGDGKCAIACVEVTVRKVEEIQAGGEGVAIEADA